jgi:hypothetical protein
MWLLRIEFPLNDSFIISFKKKARMDLFSNKYDNSKNNKIIYFIMIILVWVNLREAVA